MFQFDVPYRDEDVEILLPHDIRKTGELTDFAQVPYMPSLLLTAANNIFANFLREQIRAAVYIERSYWPPVSYNWSQASSGSVASITGKRLLDTEKHGTCRYRDQFLASFSTIISHILSRPGTLHKVTFCGLCVRKFVRAMSAMSINNSGTEELSENDKSQHSFTTQLIHFVCDNESKKAFANFADHLRQKGLIRAENACFASLLTKFTRLSDDDKVSQSIISFDDWSILQWLWTHQVFATLSTVRVNAKTVAQHYYFIHTLVFVPFVQISCNICASHAVNLYLTEMFRNHFPSLAFEARFSSTVWNNYGYFVHNFVNQSLKYVTRREYPQKLISLNEFYENVLPFLKHDTLLHFQRMPSSQRPTTIGNKNVDDNGKCHFENKLYSLPDRIKIIPVELKDTFFCDNYYGFQHLLSDYTAINELRQMLANE